ncbi:serine/threonine-protein kinase [Nocardia jiangsuensis]|uniref:Serine/threonine-protein kinase n=1 Tax=Nocardia jiangsuensis TaxID=1691563 RepID=A0ABV8DWN4_9NOCA
MDQSTHRAAADDPDATLAVNRAAALHRDLGMTVGDLTGTATATPSLPTEGVSDAGRLDILDRIEVGRSVDDFDLLTGLGSGAFARVFLARQRSLQRLVAVKISADHGTEPQTLAQLDHDYIVRVFDQKLLGAQPGDPAARRLRLLYMQFLPGGTLLSVLRWVRATPQAERTGQLLLDAVDAAMEEKGEIRPTDSSVRAEIAALSWPETVAWLGMRLAEALHYAAEHGVLHRDVKPANVLLTAEAVPKLADFNISFSRNVEGTSPVAYFGGSLAYMSPEQLEACHPGMETTAADLDARSDIYSLGVVLWELLTGEKPFDDRVAAASGGDGDETMLEAMLLSRTSGVDTATADRLPADCPASLRRILLSCLAADRAQRWSDGAVLAKQFELCLNPRARDLVDPPPHSWRIRLRAYHIPLMALAMAIPNLFAALYSIQQNTKLIIDRLAPDIQESLLTVIGFTNATFFPIGAAAIIYSSRRLLTVPRGLRLGKQYDAATLERARLDSLRLGDRSVMVAFFLWISAALIFPIAIWALTGELPLRIVLHFLTSGAMCCAIAMTYPFFLITFYMVRCIYPVFLQRGQIVQSDSAALRRLADRCGVYLTVAASIPLLAVVSFTFLPTPDLLSTLISVRAVCIGGVFAFAGAYLLFRASEADLLALCGVSADSRG